VSKLSPAVQAALTAQAVLRSGERLQFRPIQRGDALLLGAFLQGLSGTTRSYWRPHPFDQETADRICADLNPAEMIPLVGTLGAGVSHQSQTNETIAVYCMLKLGIRDADAQRYQALGIPLDPDTDATLAPCVADAYQNQGVGGLLMEHVFRVARADGRSRMVLWGGVQERNLRGVHYYTRWGFRKVGEFWTDKNNHDMIADLPS
jgi:GNAT superfamily N-acetyltransferase